MRKRDFDRGRILIKNHKSYWRERISSSMPLTASYIWVVRPDGRHETVSLVRGRKNRVAQIHALVGGSFELLDDDRGDCGPSLERYEIYVNGYASVEPMLGTNAMAALVLCDLGITNTCRKGIIYGPVVFMKWGSEPLSVAQTDTIRKIVEKYRARPA